MTFASRVKDLLGFELNPVSSKEKIVSALGGFVSMLVLIWMSRAAVGGAAATGLVASIGASAVLVFAVPHGALSQPWPVLAGHGLSALFGVACARWIPDPVAAAASAVSLAILAMHTFKCIHPPGGATAFTAVMGGPAIHELGFHFVLFPVLANAAAMIVIAFLFNSLFDWRRYPASLNRSSTPTSPQSPSHEEIIEALRSLDSFVDITEDDLAHLINRLSSRRPDAPTSGPVHVNSPPSRMDFPIAPTPAAPDPVPLPSADRHQRRL
jgi:CBS-domain-containing membrane protein